MGGIIFILVIAGYVLFLRWVNPAAFKGQARADIDDYEQPRTMSSWSRNTKANQLIAHLYLASAMMRVDRGDLRQKMQFVHRYIARYFKGAGINAGDYMSDALRNDVDLGSVAAWIKKRMTDEEKWKMIEFLIALSLEDGYINNLEFNSLKYIGHAIGLSGDGVEERVVRQQKSHEQARQSQPSMPRQRDLKAEALHILGLAEEVSLIEIKSRYRALAKRFHPDSWNASSGIEKSEAEKRFLDVQQAYEYLEKITA